MTVAQSGEPGGELAIPDEYETGLEEFTLEDAVVPRVTIVHKEGQFKDSLSGEQFPSIKAILLGLVKQRILWHNKMDDGGNDAPMCKSPDHDWGFPNLDEDIKKEKRFPWDKSGFRPEDYPPNEAGIVQLPCEGCKLKDWGSHPDGTKPYCAEQFSIPLMYDPEGEGDPEDSQFVPAIISFSKSSLKPLKAYLTSFARSKKPAYGAVTELGLNLQQRGTNEYSVPTFRKVGETNTDNWREFAANLKTLRKFLQKHPTGEDEEGESMQNSAPPVAQTDNVAKPPKKEKKDKGKKAEPESTSVVESSADDDEDLPF